MKKIIFLCLIFVTFCSSVQLFASETKNVLIINSYHKGFEWSDKIINGIEEAFDERNIDTNILYMDAKRISSPEYFKKLRELYIMQLEKHNYDLIIAVDRFSYDFILKNYKDLCISQSMFFIGMEQFSQKQVDKYDLANKVSGILERRAIDETVKMIPKLIPDIKKLYIINDKSANGDDTEPFITKAINEIGSKFEVEYIRKISFEKLKERFSTFRKNEAVFFVRFYNDNTGRFYKNKYIASFINSSKLPVFVTDTLFIGKGALGGKLVDIKQLGVNTGEKVLDIIDGKIKNPYIITDKSYDYIFDYKKAKEFKINPTVLDVKYSYVNSPLSFFEKYREFIDFVFVLSPFLLFLILGLIHNLYLRIKSAKLLKQRMQFDKVLLDAIKSPIVWQDQEGNIVDSNAKFCDLLEMKCTQTKGKKLKEFVCDGDAKKLFNVLVESSPKTKSEKEVNLINKKGDENIYLVDQTAYTENIFNTSGTVTVLTDITKERVALKEKIKHQEFIIQQSKLAEIGEIFSSIAHQWKSPLVEIATIAQEQLYTMDGEVDEQNSQYVNDIMVQVKYMTNTVDDFQKFIMPSTKKTVFNIQDAVVKMMDIIRHNIKYNYINVNINVEENCNLMVLGYRNELMQTLLNVVNNAKQAIINQRDKKIIKNGQIKINIKNIDKYVLIELEDNGGGIPIEHIKNLFSPYFTTKKDGHGIGLYMARLIIEDKMNGQIFIENANDGAKVSIKLEVYNENTSA